MIALAAGIAIAMTPALAAQGAGSTIINGGFETDAVGSTTITGWSTETGVIDLGVTSIAGCTSVDTSDYSALRDYAYEAESSWNLYFEDVLDRDDFTYVHDAEGNPVLILGDRLVWDDWNEEYYLEVDADIDPVSVPDFGLQGLAVVPLDGESPIDAPPAAEQPAETPPADAPPTEEAPPLAEAPIEESPAAPQPVDELPALEQPALEQPAAEEPAAEAPASPAPADPAGGSVEPVVSISTPAVDYLAAADWTIEQQEAFSAAIALAIPDPVERADDPSGAEIYQADYSVEVIDGVDVGREGKVLELFSALDFDESGYVSHGPAVYSDPFTVGTGRQISLDWKAVDEGDDFHVFGYLLNTDTCTQTEVIDATGEEQDWTTTSVTIPTAGTYRFVFVSGSYDYSWGGFAGAYMYIDNIVQSAVFEGPGLDLALAAAVGDYLPGSDVQISGGNLLPESAYDLVLRSTPVTVADGVTDLGGEFLATVPLPMTIAPGAHTLTLTGQSSSGPLSEIAYLTVGADGALEYFSTVGPQAAPVTPITAPAAPQLAVTGAEEARSLLLTALVLLSAGMTAVLVERRRRDRSAVGFRH